MPEYQTGCKCWDEPWESCLSGDQSSRLQGMYLRYVLTLKRLNAGGYIGSVIGAEASLTHIATAPGKHSSLFAYHQGMLTTTRYLMQ